MTTFKGTFMFRGPQAEKWPVETDGGDTVDLKAMILSSLRAMGGKPARLVLDMNKVGVALDDASDMSLDEHEEGRWPLLSVRDGFGFTNVSAYVDMMLEALASRRVVATFDDSGFTVEEDPEEVVFDLYYGSGNTAPIPEGAEKTVCRIGEGKDCCVFLLCGGDGFVCSKFCSVTARGIYSRLQEGSMNAGRVGNCAIRGRREEGEAA